MTKQKSTKRALLSSALATFLCAAMLIGSTFAWFTDTASTAVSKIQSGKLKVELLAEDGVTSLEGETLQWQKAEGAENEEILWEPGCTYKLQPIVIKNAGNLALDYKIVISGIDGDAKLSSAIEWTIGGGSLDEEKQLLAGDSDTLTIEAHMKESAGNDYQDLSIDGIGIIVYATQSQYEHDSNTNTYDADADMTPDNLDAVTVNGVAYDNLTSALENASEGSVITLCKSTTEPLKLENTEPMTIKGVTFKSTSGTPINGLQLVATSKANKVTLEDVTFDGISFTDKVSLGQSSITNGYSQCSNITFENCTFDMSSSAEKYKDAISHGDVSVTGTITDEKEANAYMNGLTVKNCNFKNTRYAINGGKARNVTVEGCNFADTSASAIFFRDLAGTVVISGNTADNTEGVLAINTVGNNYSTTDIVTNITIKDNVATNMTCDNGNVFYATFDNAKSSGKAVYTITGNSCSYTETFEEPLNGFRIKKTYGPSKAEFIANN